MRTHSARLALSFDLVWAVVGQWRFWLILGAIVYLAVRRPAKGERRSTVLCLILVAAVPLVILQSSGLSEQTRMQGVPLLLLFRLARDSEILAGWRRRLGADWGLGTLSARAGLFARILPLLFLAKLVPPLALLASLDVNAATIAGREGFSGVAKGLVRMEEGSREPRVILLQDAFDHADPTLHDRIVVYYARHGYTKLFSAEAPRRDWKIDVFVRQPGDG